MFDYLRVEYPMPDPGFEGRLFQTKDTDAQYLDTYIISKEGRLLHENYEAYLVPEEERPSYAKYKETGNEIYLMAGRVGKRNMQMVDTNYHGDIEFCDFVEDGKQESGFATWKARFTDGQLMWIKRIE